MKRVLVCAWAMGLLGIAFAQGLTVWTPQEGGALAWLRDQVASFESGFGVEVEVESLELADLQRRMLGAEEGGGADVLVAVPHDALEPLAEAGVLADVTPFATADFLGALTASTRAAFSRDDELLGLPLFAEGPALLFDRALLAEPPETYQALVQAAQRFTGEDRYGFLADVGNLYYAYGWLASHGGYVFGRDGGGYDASDVGLANAGARRGAEALRALRFDHGLIPAGADYAFAHRHFLRGSLAMFYSGPWVLRQARQAGIDVGVAPMPPLADGTPWKGFMTVHGVLLNRFGSRGRDAANLAKWLTRREAQVALARRDGRVPTSREALARLDDPALVGFGEALRHAEPIPDVRAMGFVWGSMSRALEALLEDPTADPEAVLNRAVEEIRGE